MTTIESQDLTLEKLFNDFYMVPNYQREYIWKEKQVKELLEDIHKEFSSNDSGSNSEYFIGSIIVRLGDNGVYELIDGQQRITTAYLVLCAVRDYRQAIKPDESIEALKSLIASTYTDEEGNDKFRDRVELQYEDSRGVLEKIARKDNLDKIPDTSSVQNIKTAYEQILEFFELEFGQDEAAIQHVKKFYAYFIKNVKLVRVKTASVAHALGVFATINNRGVGLDAMDLLKNLMFMQAKPKDFEKLKDKWKEMVDMLFDADEKPLRFLRYFILARYDAGERLKEDEIYDWFSKNEEKCGYKRKPLDFVNDLLKGAEAYIRFTESKDANGKTNRYLVNIGYLSTRQHLMMLLASQHLQDECFSELCRQIENLLFTYIITREGTNKLEIDFAKWTSKLRKIQDKAALEKFIAENFKPAKQKLAGRFENTFRELEESSVQKKQMRYILAKLTQYIQECAFESSGAEADLKTYNKLEVEHILPQNLDTRLRLLFDKPREIDSYVKRMGNLTLVEKPINASLGNKPFEEKKKFTLAQTFC